MRSRGAWPGVVDVVARHPACMVDVVARRLVGVVDEDDAVEVIARPKDETHDDERSRHNKIVETYYQSAVILKCKNRTASPERGEWWHRNLSLTHILHMS
jgi:Mg/Co/Ni transporter MgtE